MLSTNTPVEIGPVSWLDFISIDKLGHLIFYSIFSILVCWGAFKIGLLGQNSPFLKLLLPIAVVFIYGVMMEFLQLKFYEGRHLEFMDMAANALGAIIGSLIFMKLLVSRLK